MNLFPLFNIIVGIIGITLLWAETYRSPVPGIRQKMLWPNMAVTVLVMTWIATLVVDL